MDKHHFFSIIIPTYNCAEKLRRALESVSKQSCKDFEVIVCDDGSSDHTKEIVDTFSNKFDIHYLWQEHWGGPARPRNNGLRVAKSNFISFLDSDDWWYPNKLETVKNYLGNSDILYHDLDIYTDKGRKLFKKVKGRHLNKPVFIDLMKNENALIISGVVARKSIIEQAGGLIEDKILISLEDFDLWLKISRITEKFTYIPKSLGVYFIGNTNISQASEQRIKSLDFLYNRYLGYLSQADKEQTRMLTSYLFGRIKIKFKKNKEALELFKISAKAENIKIRIRSFFWIIYIFVFRIFKIVKRS